MEEAENQASEEGTHHGETIRGLGENGLRVHWAGTARMDCRQGETIVIMLGIHMNYLQVLSLGA